MKSLYFAVLLCVKGSVCAQTVLNPDIIYYQDFDHRAVGTYDAQMLLEDWGASGARGVAPAGQTGGTTHITGGNRAYSGNALRVTQFQNTFGGSSGAGWTKDLGFPFQNDLYFSYRIRFEDDTDFVQGGKLPGFIGGTGPTGCVNVTGQDGFSARLGWRGFGAIDGADPLLTAAPKQTHIVSYLYHMDKPGNCGDTRNWYYNNDAADRVTIGPGKWYQIECRVKINTPGVADGLIQAWIDGVQVQDIRNMRWRDTGGFIWVSGFYFSVFYGGGEFHRPVNKNEYFYFDDFVISKSRVGVNYDDSDNDGLRDNWEVENFGNITTADGTTDSDNDGRSDMQEYAFRSDPLSPDVGSPLKVTPGVGNTMTAEWQSSAQHWYQLQKSTDLVTWVPLGGPVEGIDGLMTQSITPAASDDTYFVRLSIRRQ